MVIDDTVQYISNMLNREARELLVARRPQIEKQDAKITKKTRTSTVAKVQPADSISKLTTDGSKSNNSENTESAGANLLSDSVLHELDKTMCNGNDTLNSTVTASQMDLTYTSDNDHDDSITMVKTVVKSRRKSTTKLRDTKSTRQSKANNRLDEHSENYWINTCVIQSKSASIRCNICME